MLRRLSLTFLLAGLTAAATAQTTQPEPRRTKPVQLDPAATADTVEGTYVAPGMTGAPKQQVTTNYSNRPLKKAAPASSKSSTLSDDKPRKTGPPRRP